MTGQIVVVTLLALVVFPGSLLVLPRAWHGWFAEPLPSRPDGRKVTRGDLALPWWPFSDVSRRAVVRGLIPAMAALWPIALGAITAVIGAHSNGVLRQAMHAIDGALLACFIILLFLHFMVVFYNRPKFIVPPPQRLERGLAEEWREA